MSDDDNENHSSFDDLQEDPDFKELSDSLEDENENSIENSIEENRKYIDQDLFPEEEEPNQLCSICLQRNSDVIFLPCGHADLCSMCVEENFKVENNVFIDNICPTCCETVESVLKINEFYKK